MEIGKIIIDPETQVREDLGDIAGLASDIKQNGLINPVEVRLDGEGRVHLVAGLRRLEAYKLNAEERIPTRVVNLTAKDSIVHTVSENISRNNYTPKEEALAFKAELNVGWKISELAFKHGRKQEYVKERLDLLEKLDPKVLDLVHHKKIGVETAKVIEEAPKQIQPTIARIIVDENLDLASSKEVTNRQIQEHEEAEAFNNALQKSEYKNCPICKKHADGQARGYNQKDKYAYCSTGKYDSAHQWNLRTGKTVAQEVAAINKAERVRELNRSPQKEEERLSYAFRYDVPVPVIKEALLNKATAECMKRLKAGAKQDLSIAIDNFRFEVRQWSSSAVLQSDLPDPIRNTISHLGAEPQHYQDGSLTKINPNHTARSQRGIDEQNEKLRKWLNSLPEIAEYRKKHRGQKKL